MISGCDNMYFNSEKEDTNIDSEFGRKKISFNFNFQKYKIPIFIGIGVLLLGLIIFLIVMFSSKKIHYFIELYGDETLTIYANSEYNEQGYKAYDNKGNELTGQVVIDSNLDTSKIGTYQITYRIDNYKKTREVIVVERPTGYTTIYLKGDLTVYLNIGNEYQEAGYTVIDTVDNNLTDKVKVTSNLDINKKGTYQIIYSVTNSSGVTTTEVRTVIVT